MLSKAPRPDVGRCRTLVDGSQWSTVHATKTARPQELDEIGPDVVSLAHLRPARVRHNVHLVDNEGQRSLFEDGSPSNDQRATRGGDL